MARRGHIAIDRGDPRSMLRSMNDAAVVIERERRSVLIFPEGTRSMDGNLQDFKEGAALLAIRSRTPIVPVAIIGTEFVLPSKSKEIRGGDVELRIGRPIAADGFAVKQRAQLTAQLHAAVAELRQ